MIRECAKMSWQNIMNSKGRSFLTMLGVLIGVASIIALVSVAQSATSYIASEMSALGTNKVTVTAIGTPLKSGLTTSDLESLRAVGNITGISPCVNGNAIIAFNNKTMANVAIQGRNEAHFANGPSHVESGRAINALDVEQKTRVCLIGGDVIRELFKTQSPIGKDLYINGITHTVIGTLAHSTGFPQDSSDRAVIVPYTTAMALTGQGYINSVDFYIKDSQLSEETAENIENVLNTAFNYNEGAYTASTMQGLVDAVSNMTSAMSLMLAAIAIIALIVGGVGIMNMMLVTVAERASEIGLRKALGAEPKTIQYQFIMEALFLSAFGGAFGLLLGIFASYIACNAIGVGFSIAGYSIPLALVFSAGIGLIFGYTPARKASRLSPTDALRRA